MVGYGARGHRRSLFATLKIGQWKRLVRRRKNGRPWCDVTFDKGIASKNDEKERHTKGGEGIIGSGVRIKK